jgi:ABC-type oligopeptide transport system ATPase subunit
VIISIVGESGSGKTTLAKVLLRLVKPTSGSAHVYDRLIAGKGENPSNREFFSRYSLSFKTRLRRLAVTAQ